VPSSKPVVVPHQADWTDRAGSLIVELRDLLGPMAVRIEHIGSTAIPGMAAKDTLDLQISTTNLEEVAPEFDVPLRAIGFRRSPYEADHVPAGRSDDPARWVKRLWVRREHPDGDVNVHMRLAGSPNERVALLFRDWFRAHPEAVPAYATFKLALAEVAPDIDTYTDVKDPVVDLVVSVAETWSDSTGWNP
jgi:GrpB-like predicted nucleotidyltransferase (UPF0157 family)